MNQRTPGGRFKAWHGILAAGIVLALPGTPGQAADDVGLPGMTDGEFIQNAISVKLTEAACQHREKQRPKFDRVIGDINRSLHLPDDRVALLRIAAEGVLQRTQDNSARGVVAEAEKRTKGVPPKAVGKVLATVSSFGSVSASENTLWQDVLRQFLTEGERKKWGLVMADRAAYRARAITEFVLLKVRPVIGLNQEQTAKIRPLVEKAVTDYLPDAASSFGNEDEDHSLYAPYAQILILGVPEAEARAIVNAEQWQKWRLAAGEYAENWQWVKELHERRTGKGRAR
ncbi:MAG: hypothetical protein JWO94_2218 [Verrucomicrobiaceae bacterium]|nr:hypothetical protein [Verrucomicrobiaceae bacterium]